jgi:hypothetical protein
MAFVGCRLTHVGRHVEREIVLMAIVGCRLTHVGCHVDWFKNQAHGLMSQFW